jgi:hypothetical protein
MQSVTFTEVERLQQVIAEVLRDEWEAQGHYMNGAVVKELEWKISQTNDTLTLEALMYPYANIIATGVKKDKIPFSGRTGRGGTSLYIEALQNYVKQRMEVSDDKKSLSIAFAIAHTHKKEGMPTRGSYKYSSTGKRTEWTGESLSKNEEQITDAIGEWAHNRLLVNLDVILEKWQTELNKNN